MIASIQQKNLVLNQIDKLRVRLDTPAKPGVPAHMIEVSKEQVREKIAELEANIDQYEAACTADIEHLSFDSYEEFLQMPIKIRLAQGMNLPSFAEFIGISESQLKRYEREEYKNANSGVVNSILSSFHLQLHGKLQKVG